jgi:D-cysteine desulfhydrase
MSDSLAAAYPSLGRHVPKLDIATLPTPVSTHALDLDAGSFEVVVKHDEATNDVYGGNKVRKLEYLLRRARDRGARRVATFGAVGSNHALATAIHAANAKLEFTCFLTHQKKTPKIPFILNMHRQVGTEIVPWGRGVEPLPLYRKYLQGRNTWVIPLGGTCWLGSVGFINAGLELGRQIADGSIPKPARIYIAAGTTGSVAGLVAGLAAAGLDTEVQAIQVADNPFASEEKLRRLIEKIIFILSRYDPSFTATGWQERLVWREGFLAGGYAKVDDVTTTAVDIAASQLGLVLETTYTGKAFAAMLSDLDASANAGEPWLFWNTYSSAKLPVDDAAPDSWDVIPEEFSRYYEPST